MFEFYCRLCKEYYGGCFKEESSKHDKCVQPPLPPIKFTSFYTSFDTVKNQDWSSKEAIDIREVLAESSLKDVDD